MIRNPDLSYLAEQGVLMYNISLTTEIGKKAAHLDLWNGFSKYLFEEVISLTGVPVIFLGTDAAKFKRYLAPFQWGLVCEHPAASTYTERDWDTNGVFKDVDKILKDMNGFKINWVQRYE
jgi:uracil DNA glycosylase